jgi:hypothetical protein
MTAPRRRVPRPALLHKLRQPVAPHPQPAAVPRRRPAANNYALTTPHSKLDRRLEERRHRQVRHVGTSGRCRQGEDQLAEPANVSGRPGQGPDPGRGGFPQGPRDGYQQRQLGWGSGRGHGSSHGRVLWECARAEPAEHRLQLGRIPAAWQPRTVTLQSIEVR